jgi:hypothetical protein
MTILNLSSVANFDLNSKLATIVNYNAKEIDNVIEYIIKTKPVIIIIDKNVDPYLAGFCSCFTPTIYYGSSYDIAKFPAVIATAETMNQLYTIISKLLSTAPYITNKSKFFTKLISLNQEFTNKLFN